eukprot:1157626-Pelagomonas_calceolata.AAC.20
MQPALPAACPPPASIARARAVCLAGANAPQAQAAAATRPPWYCPRRHRHTPPARRPQLGGAEGHGRAGH